MQWRSEEEQNSCRWSLPSGQEFIERPRQCCWRRLRRSLPGNQEHDKVQPDANTTILVGGVVFFLSSVLRWILESLHDPKYMLYAELWYYRKSGSCGIFSINGFFEGILHSHYFLQLFLLPITTTSSRFPVYPLFESQLF